MNTPLHEGYGALPYGRQSIEISLLHLGCRCKDVRAGLRLDLDTVWVKSSNEAGWYHHDECPAHQDGIGGCHCNKAVPCLYANHTLRP